MMLVTCALTPAGLSAQGGEVAAEECCLGLLLPVSGRAVALGRAMVANAGPESVYSNPAGLAAIDTSQFVIHHTTIADLGEEESDQANGFSLLYRTRGVGTLGLTYQLLDYGQQEYRPTEAPPLGIFSIREHFLVASFATPITRTLSGGLSYKIYQFREDCSGFCGGQSGASTTTALDAGLRYAPSRLPALRLGVSVTDLGFKLQVHNSAQASSPPARLHVGGAFQALSLTQVDTAFALWISAAVQTPVLTSSASSVAGVGAELVVARTVFLRTGYRTGSGIGSGPAVGVGVRYERFDLSLAKSFAQSISGDGAPVQVSFGIAF